MNTLAIGRRRERAIGEWMVKEGYIDRYWQPPQAKWGEGDIFGLFDFFGYAWNGYPWLVQVTKWGHHIERIKAIDKFMKETGLGSYVTWAVVAYKLKQRSIMELRITTSASWENDGGEYEAWKVDIPG